MQRYLQSWTSHPSLTVIISTSCMLISEGLIEIRPVKTEEGRGQDTSNFHPSSRWPLDTVCRKRIKYMYERFSESSWKMCCKELCVNLKMFASKFSSLLIPFPHVYSFCFGLFFLTWSFLFSAVTALLELVTTGPSDCILWLVVVVVFFFFPVI